MFLNYTSGIGENVLYIFTGQNMGKVKIVDSK